VYLLIKPYYSGTSSSFTSVGLEAGADSYSRDASSTNCVASYSVNFLVFPSSLLNFALDSFSFLSFSSSSFCFYFLFSSSSYASLSSTGFASALVSFSLAYLIISYFSVSSI
jgi:hypothetical protein